MAKAISIPEPLAKRLEEKLVEASKIDAELKELMQLTRELQNAPETKYSLVRMAENVFEFQLIPKKDEKNEPDPT